MSLGGVTARFFTGGAQSVAGAADRAKTIVGIDVCTDATPNVLEHPSSSGGMRSALGVGPLAEAQALVFNVPGAPSPYAVAAAPSVAGGVGSVTQTGNGSGAIAVAAAPHVPVVVKCYLGGALATAKFQFAINGGAYGAPVTSAAAWASDGYRVLGTFMVLTFPAGTYTINSTIAIGVDGTVTPSGGTATSATVTSAAGPFDFRGLGAQQLSVAFNAGGTQNFNTTVHRAIKAGSGASGNYPITGTFSVTVPDFPGAQAITVTGAANAGAMAAQIAPQIIGGFPVVNGVEVDLSPDREGTSSSITISSAACNGFTDGAGTLAGGSTVANRGAVTAAELASIMSAITNGTATASGGALVLTSTTTGTGGTATVLAASTADVIMGGEFATNVVKTGSAAGPEGSVSQVSSPVDNYDFRATAQKAGALGVATLAISLDGGRTQFGPPLLTPAGGVVVVPGTGVVLTCSSTFTAGDYYDFSCAAPTPDTDAISDALDALLADPTAPAACVIDIGTLPSSAAAAFTLVALVQTFLDSALAAGKDWSAMVNVPTVGDIITLSAVTELDTADTRTVIKTARVGVTANRVSVFEGTDYVQSAIGTSQIRRPRSTSFAPRIAGKLPVEPDRSTVATRDAPLGVAQIGDDERFATISLYDAQINSYQTDQGLNGAYLTIGRSLYGWQNLTTDVDFIDADGVRTINAIISGFRPTAARLVGRRFPINADGTIEEKTARGLDALLDAAIKKRAGIGIGADFGGVPQVSDASASVIRSSNLGSTGDKVIGVHVSILREGFASAVEIDIYFQGA